MLKKGMNFKITLLFFCSLFLGLSLIAPPAPTSQSTTHLILRGAIRGSINPATNDYLKTLVQEGQKKSATAILIELDTPGGLLNSVREMAQTLDDSKTPVVIYVTPAGASATSAGALLMLASDIAVMAPGTNIGAAHPVGPQGEEIKGASGEKATNDTAAFARSLADTKGRNRQLAEEIVSKSKSLTSEEALQHKLIDLLAKDSADLLSKLNGFHYKHKGELRTLVIESPIFETIEMSTGQKLLHFLANPTIAAMLMSLAILLIYVEVSNPGVIFPGVLGGICILIAFMSFQLLPIRTGGLLLILLGAAFLIAEPFVISHGALAIGGVLSFVLGLIWVIDPSATSLTIQASVWAPLGAGLGFFVAIIAYVATRTRSLSITALKEMGGGALAGLAGYEGSVEYLNSDQKSGKAMIRGENWDFIADSPLQLKDHITVIETHGLKIKIKKL